MWRYTPNVRIKPTDLHLWLQMIAITLTITTFLFYSIYWLWFRCPSELEHIPAVALIDNLKSLYWKENVFLRTKNLYQQKLYQHGYCRIWVYGIWKVLVIDPSILQQLFHTIHFKKVVLTDILPRCVFNDFLGTNIVCSNSRSWKDQKRPLNSIFKKPLEPAKLQLYLQQLFQTIDERGSFELNQDIAHLTIYSLGSNIFGFPFRVYKFTDLMLQAYYTIMRNNFSLFNTLLPFLEIPQNPFKASLYQKVKLIRGHFTKIINERLYLDECNLINNLKQSNLSEELVLNNCCVFFMAGHETTTASIIATLHLLALNLEIQEQAYQEILLNLNEYGQLDQIDGLKFMDCILKESLRMFPPVSQIPDRKNRFDLAVNDIKIPKNSSIVVDVISLHYNPQIYENPYQFNPLRFQNGEKQFGIHYSAFSNGIRRCIAKNYALNSMKLIIASFVLKYKMFYSEPTDLFSVHSYAVLKFLDLDIKLKRR